ncbi:hypothetical protein Goshw_013636 [Gossypium schwendimanii]|uniref:Uncharacterized protein n=1 Tax=Gossypium schwendimanii TaxID=34291 RepID=A0A7J9MHR9_GOSSC|nr:hypothetical protein [Gossypium schwendimanii]
MATLEDKTTKKVHMQKDDLGADEHLMVVDEDGSPNGIDRHFNSRVCFKDMLLGASRAIERVLHEQNNDDLQLLDGDVTTGIEDGVDFGAIVMESGLKARWATKEASLADSSLIVGPQDQQAQVDVRLSKLGSRIVELMGEFVEKIGATTLNSKCHSVINFVKNRNPNILMGNLIFTDSSPKQVEHTIGSASLKVNESKRLRKASHTFQDKESKFKVKAYDREPGAEMIIKVVNRIGSESLIMDSSCLQEASAVSDEATNLDAQCGDYFADFEVDVVAFLEKRVSGSKADEIISRIGLGCSHRIKAQGFAGGLWTC